MRAAMVNGSLAVLGRNDEVQAVVNDADTIRRMNPSMTDADIDDAIRATTDKLCASHGTTYDEVVESQTPASADKPAPTLARVTGPVTKRKK